MLLEDLRFFNHNQKYLGGFMSNLDTANVITILLTNLLFYLNTDVWFILTILGVMIIVNLITLLRASRRNETIK